MIKKHKPLHIIQQRKSRKLFHFAPEAELDMCNYYAMFANREAYS
jgi:hypothetical protein